MQNSVKTLDDFFEEYGFDSKTLTLKEQKQILKRIVDNAKLEQDLMEVRYHKDPGKYNLTEFNNEMEHLFFNQMYATESILRVRFMQHQEYKNKIKKFLKCL